LGESKKWYESVYYRTELKQWWEHRLYGEALVAHKRSDAQDEGEEEEEQEEGREKKKQKRMKSSSGARGQPREKSEGKGKGKGKEKEGEGREVEGQGEDGLIMDREARAFTKELEREDCLEILK